MAGNFEITEDGLVKAEIGIRGILGRKDRVKHLLNRAARSAEITMKATAPHGKTGGFERAIGKSRAEFRPGGAGGGGTWTAVVGVERTPETMKGGHSYPTNVFQGTGVFGPKGAVIKVAPGNIMVFHGDNRRQIFANVMGGARGRMSASPGIVFTKTVQGQHAQRRWYDAGRERAQLVISSNLHRVFNSNDPLEDI